jgi:hypothetical protein
MQKPIRLMSKYKIKQGDNQAVWGIMSPFIDDVLECVEGSDTVLEISVKKQSGYTKKQRGSLHVWCNHMAVTLNAAGQHQKVSIRRASRGRVSFDLLDGCKSLKEAFQRFLEWYNESHVECNWDGHRVKELIWKPVLNAIYGIDSTESQSSADPHKVYLEIARHFANKGIVVPPWPSIQNQADEQTMREMQ